MTSGRFQSVPIDSIIVNRPERQRRELRNIDDLALSIRNRGLINPITIDPDYNLIAGERRLTACRQLGWTSISVQFSSELDYYELQMIELEENVKRVDLTWQEEVEAIARFHQLKIDNEPEWTQAATSEALGLSEQDVSRKLAVASEMHNEVVANADRFAAAANIVSRNNERKKSSALESVDLMIGKSAAIYTPDEEVEAILAKSEASQRAAIPLLNTNFHEWQESYDGPKFNLIHCDFPYGINVADAPRMSATIKDHYEDSPDVYWALLHRLSLAMDNVVADSAHLIFWHSMKFHVETKDALELMGWSCHPFPFIWHKSDGAGIAPDPQRGPRQTYEAAIFATRGDRKITQAGCVANSFAHPGRRNNEGHVSEKPYAMLKHFMRMICDEYSLVLDPTCGGANALKVAEDLGANRVLGLEQLEDFYVAACNDWENRDA